MESVILVAGSGFDFEEFKGGIPATYALVPTAVESWIRIENLGRHVYLGPAPGVADEMEPEELSHVLQLNPRPEFFALDFSDITLCKELLIALANRDDLLIDNDHGVLCRGTEFVRLLRERPDWDWRRSSAPR